MNLDSITSHPLFVNFTQIIEENSVLFVLALAALYFATALFSLRAQVRNVKSATEVKNLEAVVRSLQGEIYALRAELARTRGERLPLHEEPYEPQEGIMTQPADERAPVEEVAEVIAEVEPVKIEEEEAPAEVAPAVVEERSTIKKGMAKSRLSFLGKLKTIFGGKPSASLSILDDLEEALITSDVGTKCTDDLLAAVKAEASANNEISEEGLRTLLKEGIRKELIPVESEHRMYVPVGAPLVILVVGVNGVGKTTTVAKLATRYLGQGRKVLAVAADTFRAAAVEQLKEWGNRKGFEVYSGVENAKPATVVFDGMVAAKERGVDVVLIDTAGRLHTKSNLMQELEGVRNSIRKHIPDAPHETVLVVDGISGQNALMQAREFNASTPLTGLVVTKLDGTPKGGIIVAISQELKIPVLYVGVGEKAEDLLPFSPDEFVEGLFSDEAGFESPVVSGGGSSLGQGVHYHAKVALNG
jgi:fused signal recognition particle receptor